MRKHMAVIVAGVLAAAGIVVAGVTTSDSGDDAYTRTSIRWYAETFTLAVADSNAVVAGSTQLTEGMFPEGHIVVHGCVAKDVKFTLTAGNGVDATDAGDWGVGSVAAAGTDITTTEVNIIPKTAVTPHSTTNDAVLADDAMIDGSATVADVHLNFILDGAAVNSHTNTVTTSGELFILWSLIGDD